MPGGADHACSPLSQQHRLHRCARGNLACAPSSSERLLNSVTGRADSRRRARLLSVRAARTPIEAGPCIRSRTAPTSWPHSSSCWTRSGWGALADNPCLLLTAGCAPGYRGSIPYPGGLSCTKCPAGSWSPGYTMSNGTANFVSKCTVCPIGEPRARMRALREAKWHEHRCTQHLAAAAHWMHRLYLCLSLLN